MSYLLVGDMHAVPGQLEECARVMEFADQAALRTNSKILLLGDQYDTHEIVRIEVLTFWYRTFERMKSPVIALVGNHDQAAAGSKINSMVSHENQIQVISKPTVIEGTLFVPYISESKEFVQACKENPTDTVFCHATFQGAKFENGIYAPGGIEPDAIPQRQIISGHLHTPHLFGKVRYVGAPRWMSVKDESVEDRHLNVYKEGQVAHSLSTAPFCSRLNVLMDMKEAQVEVPSDRGYNRYLVKVYGTKEYCLDRRKHFESQGVRVRTFPESLVSIKVRESEGIDKAFTNFINGFTPPNATHKDDLVELARERRLLGR